MAMAFFEGGRSFRNYEDWETYFVCADFPADAPPFSGPAGRDWNSFSTVGFEWRTDVDRLQDVARLVMKGDLSLEEGLDRFPGYTSGECRLDDLISNYKCTREKGLRLLWEAAINRETAHWLYCDEGDSQLAQARDSLELPRWVIPLDSCEGGMGCSFDAASIAIRPPYTLSDLSDYLNGRPLVGVYGRQMSLF